MLNILSKMVVKFEKQSNWQYKNSNRKFYPWILPYFGLNNALKDLADPPHFSPEIGATETFKKSPETAETMASYAPLKKLKTPTAPCRAEASSESWKHKKGRFLMKIARNYTCPEILNNPYARNYTSPEILDNPWPAWQNSQLWLHRHLKHSEV